MCDMIENFVQRAKIPGLNWARMRNRIQTVARVAGSLVGYFSRIFPDRPTVIAERESIWSHVKFRSGD